MTDSPSKPNDVTEIPQLQASFLARGIPEPTNDLGSLYESVAALKEVVETLLGLRGEGSIEDRVDIAPVDEYEPISENQGVYDQTTDTVNVDQGPLPPSSQYRSGDYLVLIANGAFITSEPNVAGRTGVEGDRIMATVSGWLLISAVGQYLSSTADDTAEGVITFEKAPVSQVPAAVDTELMRRQESDAGDDAVLAEAKTYTDTEIADHVGDTDPHGDRAYADAQDDLHSADDQQYADDVMTAHEADPDPHEQYLLESDGLELFALAAYGGIYYSGAGAAFPDIGGGWTKIGVANTASIAAPRGVTVDLPNDTLSVVYPGVYLLLVSGSFEHNNSNSGRLTSLRLFNETDGIGIGGFQIGIGRNQEATSFNISVPLDLTNGAGKLISVEIGNGDSLTSVVFTSFLFNLVSVGEFRGELPSRAP